MDEVAEYVQDLCTLVTEVVKEKMSGNIHRDYNNVLDVLHTLSMSNFFFGSLDVGELAGRWKDVLELKGRQLRRKKMVKKTVTEEGRTVQLLDFIDLEQGMFKDNWNESDSDAPSRKTKRPRAKKEGEEKPKRRRKQPVAEPELSNLRVRLTPRPAGEKMMYVLDEVVETGEKAAKKRGRKPAEDKEHARRAKKNHAEIYFDLCSEIAKASFENYCATCKSIPRSEWFCSVCYGDEAFPENPFLQCAKCGCVVHRYCYGVERVPAAGEAWLCDYCQFVQDKGLPWKWNELVCPLCYYTGGSYKQTVGGRWVHTLCAVWASEIKFGDEIRMRNISGLEAIPDSAFKYKCCACHKTGSYCIKVRTRKRREA